jgi:hypothetical protein
VRSDADIALPWLHKTTGNAICVDENGNLPRFAAARSWVAPILGDI